MFKSPRCGAKAKSTGEPCQCPAMANGRCKLHGGKSTGPRTKEGKDRQRRAVTKHGLYAGLNQPDYGEAAGPRWPGHIKGRRELFKRLGVKARPRGAIPPRDRTTGQFRPGSL